MEYTVLIQPKRGGGFKAMAPAFPTCRSSGATEEEALANLHEVLSRFLRNAKVTSIQVDENGQLPKDPWLAMAGMWRDDPTWDEYQRLIKKYRQRPRSRK